MQVQLIPENVNCASQAYHAALMQLHLDLKAINLQQIYEYSMFNPSFNSIDVPKIPQTMSGSMIWNFFTRSMLPNPNASYNVKLSGYQGIRKQRDWVDGFKTNELLYMRDAGLWSWPI
jgi:hypothetical protein